VGRHCREKQSRQQQLHRTRSYPILSTSQQLIAMLDVEDFDAVFQGLSYTDGLVQQILEYQQALGGQTFFERLLELLKIKGLYQKPPAESCVLTGLRAQSLSSQDTTAASRPPPAHRIVRDHIAQQALLGLLPPQRLVAATPRRR
jgi:hypothetical protein